MGCLRGDLVGVRSHAMLAASSQHEGVGGEGLQVFQEVGGCGLKADPLLGTGNYGSLAPSRRQHTVSKFNLMLTENKRFANRIRRDEISHMHPKCSEINCSSSPA